MLKRLTVILLMCLSTWAFSDQATTRLAFLGPLPTAEVEQTAASGAIQLQHLDTKNFNTLMGQLEQADVLLADITPPFGSPNMPADTAWVIGYMMAKGKATYLYTHAREKFAARTIKAFKARGLKDFTREKTGFKRLMDPDGYAVEEFNLWENLMIDGAAHHSYSEIQTSLQTLLQQIVSRLQRSQGVRSFDFSTQPIAREHKQMYLAGPDVFLPDPMFAARIKKEIAQSYGFAGSFPLDNNTPPGGSLEDFAMRIFYANIRLMYEADFIVANMNPYHGTEMDQGTAFEMGFMYGLGKPVLGYSTGARKGLGELPILSIEASGGTLARSFAAAVAQHPEARHDGRRIPGQQQISFCESGLARPLDQ